MLVADDVGPSTRMARRGRGIDARSTTTSAPSRRRPRRPRVVVDRKRVAQDEAPPDVEVPVEREVLVQRTARDVVRPPERLRVALDRDDVHVPAGGSSNDAGRPMTSPNGPATATSGSPSAATSGVDEVAARARRSCPGARPRAPPPGGSRSSAPPHSRAARSSGRPRRRPRSPGPARAVVSVRERGLLLRRRIVGDDDELGPGRRRRAQGVDGARDVLGPVGGDAARPTQRPTAALVEPRWHDALDP